MNPNFKQLLSLGSSLGLLTISLSVSLPAKASLPEPFSCAGYAVTNSERQLVEVLQDMNAVKSEMVTIDKQLMEYRSQMDRGYDSSSSESVNRYNLLVNEFNSLVSQRNQLGNKHNSLKDTFNSLVKETSPSRNSIFVICMNGEVVATDADTVKLNADSLR